jgi:hypothetical protein
MVMVVVVVVVVIVIVIVSPRIGIGDDGTESSDPFPPCSLIPTRQKNPAHWLSGFADERTEWWW